MEFKDILKDLRESEYLSQGKLAKLTGIPQSTIANYELGQTQPNIKNIIILAKHFNITTDELLNHNTPINIKEKFIRKNIDEANVEIKETEIEIIIRIKK